MQEFGARSRVHPELRQLVAEASRALASLDADRLDELAISCQALNRDLETLGEGDRIQLAQQAREANADMAVLGRILEVTRGNLNVIHRLQELRGGRLEYSARPERGWTPTVISHGDN
jgi:hypothetical protein